MSIASNEITKAADPNATIIWGAAFDESYQDEMQITVIATGFDEKNKADFGIPDYTFKSRDDSMEEDIDSIMNIFKNKGN